MHASKSIMNTSFKVEMLKQIKHAMPEMHYHDFYEIYIQDQGERDHVVSNTYYKLSPKDVLLIKPNVLHQSISDKTHTRTIIYFKEELLEQYFTKEMCQKLLFAFQENHLALSSESYYKASNIIRDLIREDQEDNYNAIFLRLAELLLLLTKSIEQVERKLGPLDKKLDVSISPLVTYVHENFMTLDNINTIADTFFMTSSHLCRTFKKITGYTIIQYINNLKIQQACLLLKESNKSITDIALDCGFNSTMYFCRIFKQLLQITPSEYRRI